MGSQGSLGGIHGYLGWDTVGGPMGPWDRWDLGTDGTWASRTPDTSSELFYRYPAQPAWPGLVPSHEAQVRVSIVPLAPFGTRTISVRKPVWQTCFANLFGIFFRKGVSPFFFVRKSFGLGFAWCQLPGPVPAPQLPGRPFFRKYFPKKSENCSTDSRDQNKN